MALELAAGTVLGGRYRLMHVLAEGGMAVLWVAERVGGDRGRVAVKLLKGGDKDENLRRRLLREARALASLEHPNVVTIHEVLELEDGAPALVMDLLEGESLRARLDRERTLAPAEAARLMLPVVAALQSAHALGIVHRDLKPENVFLARDPAGTVTIKVLDFGIAKFTALDGAAQTAALTNAGIMLGTPYYMAPEQVLGGDDIDGRTDVWALGVILYECLAGVRPIEDENVGKVLRRVLAGAIRPLGEEAPSLPRKAVELVGRMLSLERSERPADLADVRATLELLAMSRAPARVPFARPGAEDQALSATAPAHVLPQRSQPTPMGLPLASARAPDTLARMPSTPPAPARRVRRWALFAAVTAAGAALTNQGMHRARHAAPPASLLVEPPTSARCPAGMVLVPGGDFMMGVENGADDERPVHRVSVRDLCMDRTEVTVAAYLSCVAREACRPPSASVEYGDLSDEQRASENRYCDADATGTHNAALNCVSFTQASAYGETMGKRLPTEEEWEHAARGGAEQRLYPWGAEPPGPQLLNACGSECVTGFAELGVTLSPMYAGSDGFVGVAPVGRFPAGDSRDGIHDLAGNVGEWTASPYCPYPRHDCKSPYRVFRGGSFQTEISARARAGARVYSNPDYRYMQVGFRCAADAARP